MTVITKIATKKLRIILSINIQENAKTAVSEDTHKVKEITKIVQREVAKEETKSMYQRKTIMKVESDVKGETKVIKKKLENEKIVVKEEVAMKEEAVGKEEIAGKSESTRRRKDEEVPVMIERIEKLVILTRINITLRIRMMKKIVTRVANTRKSPRTVSISTTMMINVNVVEALYFDLN